mmetsp:Transcript_14633/g.19721  ORF Transcript_14633/g.19721 Transcript_14633/m.19721 type:complete len:302 (+) Transcript_14633:31-936(+)
MAQELEAPGEAEAAAEAAPVDETPKVKDSMNFPRNHLKSILGHLGETIGEIRKNGADVWIKPTEENIEVNFLGSGEEVEAAKKHVISVAQPAEEDDRKRKRDDWEDWGGNGWNDNKRGWGDGGDWNDNRRGWNSGGKGSKGGDRYERKEKETETMELELSAFGCIVGPGGAKIKEVRTNSGAHVSIDKLATHVEVKMVGMKDQVAAAKQMVQDLVAGGGQSKGAEKTEILQFEGSVMGNIIGTGGKRINDVRKQSGADVSVKKVDECCEVTIAGTQDAVETAKMMVNNFVQAARAGVSPAA